MGRFSSAWAAEERAQVPTTPRRLPAEVSSAVGQQTLLQRDLDRLTHFKKKNAGICVQWQREIKS